MGLYSPLKSVKNLTAFSTILQSSSQIYSLLFAAGLHSLIHAWTAQVHFQTDSQNPSYWCLRSFPFYWARAPSSKNLNIAAKPSIHATSCFCEIQRVKVSCQQRKSCSSWPALWCQVLAPRNSKGFFERNSGPVHSHPGFLSFHLYAQASWISARADRTAFHHNRSQIVTSRESRNQNLGLRPHHPRQNGFYALRPLSGFPKVGFISGFSNGKLLGWHWKMILPWSLFGVSREFSWSPLFANFNSRPIQSDSSGNLSTELCSPC